MHLKGKLIKWNATKAFGFIAPNDGGEAVFIHKKAFSNRQRTPKINDVLTFTIIKDNQGRYCADHATFTGEKIQKTQTKNRNQFSIYLSVVFMALLTAAYFFDHFPQNLLLIYLGLSIVTFIAYAIDKSKAQRGAWRTQESTLHLLSLFGGWPGAAIAQQKLRHKSKKRVFRIVYWLTVLINIVALAWLMTPQGAFLLALFH